MGGAARMQGPVFLALDPAGTGNLGSPLQLPLKSELQARCWQHLVNLQTISMLIIISKQSTRSSSRPTVALTAPATHQTIVRRLNFVITPQYS